MTNQQVSTHVFTHQIYYEHPLTKEVKTIYCSATKYKEMRQCYDRRISIDLGEGKSVSWTLFKGGERIDPKRIDYVNCTTYTRKTSERSYKKGVEREHVTYEVIEKRTGRILSSRTEDNIIKEYPPEDAARHERFTQEMKDRQKTGKSIKAILHALFNKS